MTDNFINIDRSFEQKRFILSQVFPFLFVLSIWLIKIIEIELDLDLFYYGIFPRKINGLMGIITSPFIHSDYKHLINNSIPIYVLSTAIFYFYRPISFKIVLLSYLLTGMCVWLAARSAYHIGASGLLYGIASFLFFSGIIRNDMRLMAISLIVVFLYGSMVWGIFPIEEEISWESHMWGSVSGLVLSIYYRNMGPKKKTYEWEDEEDEEDNDDNEDEEEVITNYPDRSNYFSDKNLLN